MACGNWDGGAYVQWPGDFAPGHIKEAWRNGEIAVVIRFDTVRARAEYHFSRLTAARRVAGLPDAVRRDGIRYVAGRPIDAVEIAIATAQLHRESLLRARREHVSQLRWLVRFGGLPVATAAALARRIRATAEIGYANAFEEVRILFGQWLWVGGCRPDDKHGNGLCNPCCPCGRWGRLFGPAPVVAAVEPIQPSAPLRGARPAITPRIVGGTRRRRNARRRINS